MVRDDGSVAMSLDERAKRLAERAGKAGSSSKPVRVPLDFILSLIRKVDANPELKVMFGGHVSSKLAIIADNNDLRLCDAKVVNLTAEQEKRFIEILQETLAKTISEHKKSGG